MFIPSHIRQAMAHAKFGAEDSVSDIQFVNIAYRPKPPGSATGGPNGVLKLLSDHIGKQYRGFYSRYVFEPANLAMPNTLKDFVSSHRLKTMSKKLLEAEYFVCNELPQKLPADFAGRAGTKFVFVCHDIGSAVGAHSAGYPYVLVYHQQGGFAHERMSFGEQLNTTEKLLMDHYEKIAFENALEVVFPSKGAREAFEKTTATTDVSKVNFGIEPVYNSSDAFDVSRSGAMAFLIANGLEDLLDEERRKDYLVFTTIGDYSYNKGVDRCPDLLSRVAAKTKKKVVWIALGSKHRGGYFERLEKDAPNMNFKAVLSPKRLPHDIAMGLVEHADWFLMQQRHAIFDFSSLEAMSLSKGLVLSPVEGNLDFDRKDNVVFFDPDAPDAAAVKTISKSDPKHYGRLNREVFEKDFSREEFVSGYLRLYDRIIEKSVRPATKPALPDDGYADVEKAIRGKSVLIMGAGESASFLQTEERKGKTLISLNRAALLEKFTPDVHVMQDQPHDPHAWSQYLQQDVLRLYGRIHRKSREHLAIPFGFLDRAGIPYSSYNLDDAGYDARSSNFNLNNLEQPIRDASGVFFSAVQLCVLFGAKSIEVVGVDFSDENFDGKNPNSYNSATMENFAKLMEQLRDARVDFSILHTTSADLSSVYERSYTRDKLRDVDFAKQELIEQILNSNKSTFRKAQAFASEGLYEEALWYLDTYLDLTMQLEPRFLKERIQALRALKRHDKLKTLLKGLPEDLKAKFSNFA